MMRQLLPILITAFVFARAASAQESPFEPLALPSPNEFRASTGEPGEQYWQQRADYKIAAALTPQDKMIRGSVTIHYTNNSPYALDYLWLQLDQNLFRVGSRGSEIQPPQSRWRGSFEGGGYNITNVRVGANAAEFMISDTRMRIDLSEPVQPEGSTVDISMDYTYQIPQYGADRTGWLDVERGTVFEMAQWYPRMYVIDDVNGWNPMPYLGQGEFYLEYGDIDYEVTVPHGFIVGGTGVLQNPDEVLTAEQRRRLDRARGSDETVRIVNPEEVGTQGARPSGSGPLTWKFRAENVRDVAWGASQAFIWDAASWNGVLNMSFYPHEGLGTAEEPGWEKATEYVRHSIKTYSEMWFPYPYPVAINIAGIVGGMEYPMIVFCSVRARDRGLFGVTTHEIGHEWYPMVVGSDERRYPWMDEGFNTFINHYSTLAYYGEDTPTRLQSEYIAGQMKSDIADQATYTYADRIRREGLGFLAYRKPAMGLYLLREYILGEDVFDEAFREYTSRWAYKHPQPADFFRSMENVSGEDLDWFWRGWFMSTALLDQSVVSVEEDEGATQITVEQGPELVLPVELQIAYEDGTSEMRRIPVEAFFNTDTFTEVVTREDVESVVIDPRYLLPDAERDNNIWGQTAPAERQ